MHIATEKDISGHVAKQLRIAADLTQKEFWASLGLTQSGGSRYENENSIPKPIRILIFAVYVAGIRIDAETQPGADQLKRLAMLQASEHATDKVKIGSAIMDLNKAVKRTAKLLNSTPV